MHVYQEDEEGEKDQVDRRCDGHPMLSQFLLFWIDTGSTDASAGAGTGSSAKS